MNETIMIICLVIFWIITNSAWAILYYKKVNKYKWNKRYTEKDKQSIVRIVFWVDLAVMKDKTKGDYSTIVVVGKTSKGDMLILDGADSREGLEDFYNKLVALFNKWKPYQHPFHWLLCSKAENCKYFKLEIANGEEIEGECSQPEPV